MSHVFWECLVSTVMKVGPLKLRVGIPVCGTINMVSKIIASYNLMIL